MSDITHADSLVLCAPTETAEIPTFSLSAIGKAPLGRTPYANNSISKIFIPLLPTDFTKADTLRVLRECRRILKPKGKLLLCHEAVSTLALRAQQLDLQEQAHDCGLEIYLEDSERLPLQIARVNAAHYLCFAKPQKKLPPPRVSIVIPAFRVTYLENCLASCLAQTYQDLEIIVLDDSPDRAIETLVGDFMARDKRISYMRNTPPLGEAENLTRGIRLACGELIKPLCDDDELYPQAVERLLAAFLSTPDCTLASGKRQPIDASGNSLSQYPIEGPAENSSCIDGREIILKIGESGINCLGEPSAMMFRRSDILAIRERNIMSLEGKACIGLGDACTATHLLSRGDLAFVAEPVCRFRVHVGQTQRQKDTLRESENTWRHFRESIAALGFMAEGEALPPRSELESGIAHFQAGNFEAALHSLSRCIVTNPDEVEAYFYLALICAAQGMMPESASFIHEALMLAPERSDLQAQLGEYCLEKGHIEAGRQHLAEAVARQADLFPAYPGLAEAMRQSGQLAEAAKLLESVASYPGPAQSAIVAKLLEVLTQQGNLERIVACCNRARQDLALQGLGIRLQTRSGIDAQHLRQALERLHSRLCPPSLQTPARKPKGNGSVRIAFVLSDFQRTTAARHLELLLRRLPVKDFLTILVDNDPNTPGNELAERSALLADRYIPASMLDDDALAQSLNDAAPDILVDFDGPGARQRLAAICRVNAPLKLSWSDLPPWGLTGLRQMCGEWLQPTENGGVPPLALDGLGEFLELPATEIVRAAHEAPRFACLTPSIRVSEDSWDCFASLLKRLPDALLVVNLGELAGPAQQRIIDIFARREINADRLHFIRANDTEALCAIWNEVDVGLAPLHGDGDDALPTCLWMERPYVALDSPHSWSRRPAALLQLAGLGHLVAVDRENYQKIAEQLIHTPLAAPGREWLRRSPLTDASHFVADFATRLAKALIAS
jgi:predicted O-linked N-acetylglucosamine transferase (SPINDLY family)